MNIKDELDKSIPENVELTEKEKTTIRYRVRQTTPTSKLSFKPILVSVFCIMIAGVLLLANIQPMIKDQSASNPINTKDTNQLLTKTPEGEITKDTNQVLPKIPENQITEEKKQQYYEEYKEIMNEAMEQKVGVSYRVPSKEKFEETGWVKPGNYEKMIQNNIDTHLKVEREKRAAMASDLDPAVTVNGETTKSIYIYFSGKLKEIEVTAEFDTQHSEDLDREVFESVENVSTEFAYPRGTWEQTSVKPRLVNDGKKYSIRIEGTWSYNSVTFEKVFTIEFNCDEAGDIN